MRGLLTLSALTLFATSAVAQKEFGFDNRKGSGQPYLTPEETVAKFKVAPEFEVKLFAGEPMMTNPIAFTIDEKGRIWVVESFEYPKRTPKGQMPRDRIVILEDTDGDGAADKRTVFAEGKDFPESFHMASGIEVGHGGVYLGAPPYLWFIENKNDKPGKFEILAKGFGSEDTHETLNTFQWGPDGWLYGLHGVFTQSNVKVGNEPEVKMNAAVWRFHPKTKKFEIFSEGTSNPWGMDYRNTDGEWILACCVIPHLYHMVPGGIYQRQGGVSNNPYAYNFIKEISDHTFHRESGWAHAGLISLDVPHIPEKYRNSVIFGSIHGCSLKQNILKPNGSSFIASKGEDFLVSGDKNFRPINLKWGPLGDIYLIDWHDQNPCHQTKPDDWDYERGRVYRIQLKGTQAKKAEDLGKKSIDDLQKLLLVSQPYHYRTALRLLSEKSQSEQFAVAKHMSKIEDAPFHRRHWVMRGCNLYSNDQGEYDPNAKNETLPEVGQAIIRSLAEMQDTKPGMVTFLAGFASNRFSAPVRREIASAAIRLSAKHDVTPILRALMSHKEDAKDPLIPHLTWLSLEKTLAKRTSGVDEKGQPTGDDDLKWLAENAAGNPFITEFIIPKVVRRLVAKGQPGDYAAIFKFIETTKDLAARRAAVDGLVIALQGQQIDPPAGWAKTQQLLANLKDSSININLIKLGVAFRDPAAHKRAVLNARNPKRPFEERLDALRQIAVIKNTDAIPALLEMAREEKDDALRVEAVRTLGSMNNKDVAIGLVSNWEKFSAPAKAEAIGVLASRKEWAAALLTGMQANVIERSFVNDNTITKIQALGDKRLNTMIEEVWGRTRQTPEQLLKEIDKMRIDINSKPGSFARGAKVFEAQCAKCHKFDGSGNDVGPALDGAGRDIEYLLGNILDPNRVIGAPYFVRQVNTTDGQVIQGVLAEEDPKFLTLKVENGVLKKIAKTDIDGTVKVLEKSMMPEGLGNNMTTDNFRDLVRYTMAHPFITNVTIDETAIVAPVGGRIPLPKPKDDKPLTITAKLTALDTVKTKFFIGAADPFEVQLNGKVLGKGNGVGRVNPDTETVDLQFAKGEHTITILLKHKGIASGLYLRLLDPDRKLRYAE